MYHHYSMLRTAASTLLLVLGLGSSWARGQINRAPDALGVMPDSVGVYYSDQIASSVVSSNGSDTDASKEGEFLSSSAGIFWFQRHRPVTPQGASARDEVDIYWKNSQGVWVYQSTLMAPVSAGSGSEFGSSVVAYGNRLYVGAPSALNSGSVATGVVYVYEMDGWALAPTQTIEPPDGAVSDKFGASLAVDGDRLIIGAPGKDKVEVGFTISDAGAAYLYERNTSWTFLRTEVSTVAQDGGQFGFSVGLKGRVVAIGAPYEDGWFTVGNTTYVMGDTGTIHVGRWDRPGELLGFYNLFSLFGPVQNKIQGLGSSHFGWSVAVDGLMRIVVSMPDSSWTAGDNMTGWDSGLVMLMNWNGSVDQDYLFNITGFSHGELAPGSRFGEYLEEAQGSVDFGVKTGLLDGNASVKYYATTAVQVEPGQLVGGNEVPDRMGDLTGMDEDGDALTYSVSAAENFYGSYFQVGSAGELQGKASLANLSNGLYSLKLAASDGNQGVLVKSLAVELFGALTDTDGDLLPDNWETGHGLDPNVVNSSEDPDGDGWTNLQEFQRGTVPTFGDRDGDGASDQQELTDGTDPGDPLSVAQPVVWASLVNTTIQGASGGLKKTSGSGTAYDADAVGSKQILKNGRVTFKATAGGHLFLGLNSINSSRDWTEIDYAWHPQSSGTLGIYESGVHKLTVGTWTSSTELTIVRVGDVVQYWKDGVLAYTSLTKSSGPVLVDTGFYSTGSEITSARYVTGDVDGDGMLDSWEKIQLGAGADLADVQGFLPGNDADGDLVANLQEYLDDTDPNDPLSQMEYVVWGSHINTVSVGGNGGLRKGSGAANTYDADAVSSKRIHADGKVSFKVVPGHYVLLGLNAVNSDRNYTDLDYAIHPHPNGNVLIYEAGVLKGDISPCNANTVLTIERVGSTVRYLKDGIVVYTSQTASSGPLLLDTAFYNVNAALAEVRYKTGDVDNDDMPDVWELAQLPPGSGLLEVQGLLPGGDLDSDGSSNLNEYRDGTNPQSSLSAAQPIVWTSHVNTASQGAAGGLKKITGGTNVYDADAVSTKKVLASGRLTFRATSGSHLMVGINYTNTSRDWPDLDYAWHPQANGTLGIYESGAHKVNIGTWNPGTVLAIERAGDVVRYFKDGVLVYVSATRSSGPILVDTVFYTVNSEVAEARFVTGDLDGDGMADAWELANLPGSPGLTELNAFLPGSDPDGDSLTNLQEYMDRTNPHDVFSRMEPVVWSSHINTASVGTNGGLQKTAGATGSYDAEALSSKRILADGAVNFKVAYGHYILVGFNGHSFDRNWTELDHAIHPHQNGSCYVVESGAYKLDIGPYTANTVFTIEREGVVVRYRKDGALVYTSQNPSIGAVVLDNCFYQVGTAITEARYNTGDVDNDLMPDAWERAQLEAGATLVDVQNFTPTGDAAYDNDGVTNLEEYRDGTNPFDAGNTLEPVQWTAHRFTTSTAGTPGGIGKTSGAADWNGDAIGTKKIIASGQVRFKVGSTTKNIMVGLNAVNDNANYTELDFALHVNTTSAYVYENGTQKANLGAYTAATQFAIKRLGEYVGYFKDSALVYASTVKCSGPLLVDCAFYQIGDSIAECRIGTDDTDNDGMPDSWELAQLGAGASLADVQAYLPSADPDTDGATNLQEYQDGTNPNQALSRMESVVWSALVNTAAVGTNGGLRKSSGAVNTYDADAVSTKKILVDGAVSFKVVPGYYALLGLNAVNSDRNYTDLDFAIHTQGNGNTQIYEAGVLKGDFGPWNVNTVFAIERVAGVVSYRKDGVVIYTSQTASTGPVMLDNAFFAVNTAFAEVRYHTGDVDNDGMPDAWELKQLPPGSGLAAVQAYLPGADGDGDLVTNLQEHLDNTDPTDALNYMEAVVWTAHRNTQTQGAAGGLGKTAGAADWTGDAISTKKLSGNGELQFLPGLATKNSMVGLNEVNDSAVSTDLDYGIVATTSGYYIQEQGVNKLQGTYTAASLFRIERMGDTITYYKDGVLVYTSLRKSVLPLMADAAFYQIGDSFAQCQLKFATKNAGEMSAAWRQRIVDADQNDSITTIADVTGSGDFDQDGLTDLEEWQLGTDPLYADTDRDGMPDAWEVQYFLSPLNPGDALGDPDSDGWSNLEEYLAGTDPRTANVTLPGMSIEGFIYDLSDRLSTMGGPAGATFGLDPEGNILDVQ